MKITVKTILKLKIGVMPFPYIIFCIGKITSRPTTMKSNFCGNKTANVNVKKICSLYTS